MDYKEKATILQACSSKKGERCSSCPAFGQGFRTCMKNAMKDGAAAIRELLVENQALRNTADGFKKRAEAAEAEVEQLRNEHVKIQYNGEELTIQEICERLDDLQNKANKYECEIRKYTESCDDCNFCKMED